MKAKEEKKEGVAVVVTEKPKAPEGICRCCGIKIAAGEIKKSENGCCLSCSQKIWRARKIGKNVKMIFA